MRFSVAQRLAVLGAAGAVCVCTVAAIGFTAASSQATDAAAMARISASMSHQWNADMMHDGIRGDVMSAMYATSDQQREQYETADVTAKATEIVADYDHAAAGAPPAIARQFAQIRPQVVRYAQQAVALVDLAGRNKAAAQQQLPQFLTLFGQLEGQLGKIDDALLAAVNQADSAARHGAQQPRS